MYAAATTTTPPFGALRRARLEGLGTHASGRAGHPWAPKAAKSNRGAVMTAIDGRPLVPRCRSSA